MSKCTNKHCRNLEFGVGDAVFLKLRPLRQQSVANKAFAKLSARYFGAFIVLAKVGAIAYKLSLPKES